MKKVLEVNNITKKINGKTIIENITLDLEKGDVHGFLGGNGAGKSTTIKGILGLIKLDSGYVKINGQDLKGNEANVMKNLGAMVEVPSFYEYMTAYKNLQIFARLYGLDKERIEEVLKIVDITIDKKKVKTFSTGMRQRLGIARALLNSPDIIILDEPTNGLDPKGIIEIRNLIKKLAEEDGVTFLISSHILSEMENICNKITIINEGKIVIQGDLKELIKNNEVESLEKLYIKVLGSDDNA